MQNLFLIQEAFAAGDAAVWPSQRMAVALGALFVGIGIAVLTFTKRKN